MQKQQKNESIQLRVCEKGIALVCAINCGLLPNQTEQGRDIAAFENFWELFTKKRTEKLGITIE